MPTVDATPPRVNKGRVNPRAALACPARLRPARCVLHRPYRRARRPGLRWYLPPPPSPTTREQGPRSRSHPPPTHTGRCIAAQQTHAHTQCSARARDGPLSRPAVVRSFVHAVLACAAIPMVVGVLQRQVPQTGRCARPSGSPRERERERERARESECECERENNSECESESESEQE